MRVHNCFIIVILFFFAANGQAPNADSLGTVANILDPSSKSASYLGRPVWKSDGSYTVTGSVFYHDDMHKGRVLLSNGKSASDVLLRYNLYTQRTLSIAISQAGLLRNLR